MKKRAFEKTTNGALSLSLRNDTRQPWWWYLDLFGTPLYLLGNNCGTCSAIFRRVQNAQLPLTPQQLSDQLALGLTNISPDVVDMVATLLPKGRYNIELASITPSLITRQNRPSQISCEADYFWLCRFEQEAHGADYEIILPMVVGSELHPDRIAFYKAMLESGQNPTALAFSMRDGRVVRGEYYQEALAHFLLDGHHKVMAASQLSKSISMLSFVRLDTYAETVAMQ